MCDVTRILGKIEAGDPSAAEQLLPLVYEELRKLAAAKMAQEKPDQTLQATALVHEAYIRLVDVEQGSALGQPGPFLCGGRRGHAADSGRAGPPQEAAEARGRVSAGRPVRRRDPTIRRRPSEICSPWTKRWSKLASAGSARRRSWSNCGSLPG